MSGSSWMIYDRATAPSMSRLLFAFAISVLALSASRSAFVDAMRIPARDPSSSLSACDIPIKGSRRCIACQDPNAITCTSSGAVTCKSGIAPKNGFCLASWDCDGAPPRYLAPDNVSCYPCSGKNATPAHQRLIPMGGPEVGTCVAVKCSTSSVNTEGKGCCPDPYAITCNSGGSHTCKYLPPSNGKCPGPVDCSGSPPRYPSKDSECPLIFLGRRSCLDCPVNATSCDVQGNATACSYGVVTGGKCKMKDCPKDRVSSLRKACCPKFALTCKDEQTTLTCEKGCKIDDVVNGTTPFRGPYMSRYGGESPHRRPSAELCGKFNFVPYHRVVYRQGLYRASLEECAERAHELTETAWMWTSKLERDTMQCLLVRDRGAFAGTVYPGAPALYDFGTFGTCADTTKHWSPQGTSHRRICKDVLLA
ncbi:BQ2448_2975 [Microbotryum intermedium]|uniref:BQ2448_2975 protein n=1 Tax=Microbotryum intermedium TaxID=269621 RepID=A0A238FDV7_9BASI|nr:BQ2448_2975 [Microbotryum intermedium]